MITTKTGDEGQTTCGNRRVDKDDLLVELIGGIDELQAILEIIEEDELVDDLGKIMGELACDLRFKKYNLRVKQFENEIKNFNLDKFLVFKTKKAKELNWARTVCRRVERRLVSLAKRDKIGKEILKYFNRLSDYLFVKAVKEN